MAASGFLVESSFSEEKAYSLEKFNKTLIFVSYNKHMQKILRILLGLIISGSLAYANTAPAPVAATSTTAPQAQQDLCPAPETLVKHELFWHAPHGWVSYSESFDTHITQFVKAEWIGINVGKIICIYKGDKKFAFPIALEQKHNKITPMPTGYHWGSDIGGYKECNSNNIKDCPFVFEKTKDTGDVYEGLDFFKDKPENND